MGDLLKSRNGAIELPTTSRAPTPTPTLDPFSSSSSSSFASWLERRPCIPASKRKPLLLLCVASVLALVLFLRVPVSVVDIIPDDVGECVCPLPRRRNISRMSSDIRKADAAYELGTLDIDAYLEELVSFMPEREDQLRKFLDRSPYPSSPFPYSSHSPLSSSSQRDSHLPQIPPRIWQTSRDGYTSKDFNSDTGSWQAIADNLQWSDGRWTPDGSWTYSRLSDAAIENMWPPRLRRIWEICASLR
jgi:hypothetical protein